MGENSKTAPKCQKFCAPDEQNQKYVLQNGRKGRKRDSLKATKCVLACWCVKSEVEQIFPQWISHSARGIAVHNIYFKCAHSSHIEYFSPSFLREREREKESVSFSLGFFSHFDVSQAELCNVGMKNRATNLLRIKCDPRWSRTTKKESNTYVLQTKSPSMCRTLRNVCQLTDIRGRKK